MLLIIEDRNDPAGAIAAECDGPGGTELAYIPAIRVFFPGEPAQVRRECALARFLYERRREGIPRESSPAARAALVPLYLKAVLGTGWPPFGPGPARAGGGEGGRTLSQKA